MKHKFNEFIESFDGPISSMDLARRDCQSYTDLMRQGLNPFDYVFHLREHTLFAHRTTDDVPSLKYDASIQAWVVVQQIVQR